LLIAASSLGASGAAARGRIVEAARRRDQLVVLGVSSRSGSMVIERERAHAAQVAICPRM
jgi:hypothetical protein